MSSLRLTPQLSQRMVLTPQFRQRIEMLQMNSLELNELIEQEIVANPILEEVQPGDEVKEIGDNILDQNSDGADHGLDNEAGPTDAVTDPDFATEFQAVVPEGAALNGSVEKESAELDTFDRGHTGSDLRFDDILESG